MSKETTKKYFNPNKYQYIGTQDEIDRIFARQDRNRRITEALIVAGFIVAAIGAVYLILAFWGGL